MNPALLTLNIVVWLAALAYSFKLVPPLAKRWNAWVALGTVVIAGTLSVATFALERKDPKQELFLKHYHAAIDERQRGNLLEAEQELERALAVRPGNPDAKRELAEIQQQKPAEKRVQRKEVRVTPVPESAMPAPSTSGTPPPEPQVKGDRPGEKPKPAPHKPSPFEITHYALDVTLDPDAHTLLAVATVRVRSRGEALRTLELSLSPEFKTESAQVDGARAEIRHTNDLLVLTPSKPLPSRGEATVVVRYTREGGAQLESGDAISPVGTYLRSESRWYPATGELDFRSPVRVRATVPAGYTVVSVGELRGKQRVGDQTLFHWETERYASMVSLAAAKYTQQAVTVAPVGAGAPLKLTAYTFPEHKERAEAFLKEAAATVRYFQKLYGPYPYEKLAVVEIPFFPGGYGTTSFVMLVDKAFAEKRVDREFLAHEIAHQWWGNSVFPQGLGAAWLTEAFANYSAWMYDEARGANPRIMQRRIGTAIAEFFNKTAARGDQAINETDPYQQVGAWDAILYEKGAVVLHMLRREVGDRPFRRSLRRFADQFRFSKAKIPDFQKIVEAESGQKLDWFFDQWLGRTGGMELSYSFANRRESPGQGTVELTVTQPKPAYRARMNVTFQVGNRSVTRTLQVTGESQVFEFPVDAPVTAVLFDPETTYLMRPPRWVVPTTPAQ